MPSKIELWREWTREHLAANYPIHFFEPDEALQVSSKQYGKNDHEFLKRSSERSNSSL